MIDILLRAPNNQDGSFILDSWVRENREQYPNNLVDKSLFYTEEKKIVKILITKSLILIACNPDDTDQIYGYLVFEKIEDIPIIHFLYVKLLFRENGVAKQLIESVFPDFGKNKTIITHVPRSRKEDGKFIDFAKNTLIHYNLRYDPFIIERRINKGEK